MQTDNISKSAKIAKVSEMTAHKWLKTNLKDEINNLRKKYIEDNLKRLEYTSIKAVAVIIEILEDKECSKSVKLNASKQVIDYSLKLREHNEIITRLENIERRINNNDR